MTEQSQQDRLAALASRRPSPAKKPSPAEPVDAAPSVPVQSPAAVQSPPRSWRPSTPSPARLATAGASLVSFAAMVVAMGPLTADAAEDVQAEPTVDDIPDTEATVPTQPQVVIEVIPNYVSADGTPLAADELAFTSDEISEDQRASLESATSPVQAQPAGQSQQAPPAAAAPAPAPAAAAPVTAPPVAAAPVTAPVTAPPATAPVTAPPATAPPATAPPAAAPQPTPPPRSGASG